MDAIAHTIIAVGSIAAAFYVGRWNMLRAVHRQQQLEIEMVKNFMREARLAEMRGDFQDFEPEPKQALQLQLFTEKQLQQ